MAFRKGEDTPTAQVGALLIVEFLRLIRAFIHALFGQR
jgi:hypothetical protein